MMAKIKKLEELEDVEDYDLADDEDFEEEFEAEVLSDEETDGEEQQPAAEPEQEPLKQAEEEVPHREITFEEKLEMAEKDPTSQAKWYVVHTYSGHENKVKVNIEKIVENRGMQDLVLDIVVPTEDRVEIKDGQRKIKTRKMFPGYVIVKMIVTSESWYLVRNTQGVTGFVGHGSEPIPLTDDEVKRMGIDKVYIDIDIEAGDSVKVINGPFESFMGTVEEVNMDKQILRVRISMFGRDTPVELEFGQIIKL